MHNVQDTHRVGEEREEVEMRAVLIRVENQHIEHRTTLAYSRMGRWQPDDVVTMRVNAER